MPAVAKKPVKTKKEDEDVDIKPKKSTVKKLQKTSELNAAKKLAKQKAKRAISDKVCFNEHIIFDSSI